VHVADLSPSKTNSTNESVLLTLHGEMPTVYGKMTFLMLSYPFLSHVSTLRDIDTANLSVCLSVMFRYQNGLTYCHNFFTIR